MANCRFPIADCLAHSVAVAVAGNNTVGNNNGRSPEHFIIEEIATGNCVVGGNAVPCVSPTVMPLGSPVQTVSSWQNLMYDMRVPHYNNNIQNLRPTRIGAQITTTLSGSKIMVQTQFNIACHSGSHVCRWSPALLCCHDCLSGTVCCRQVLVVATGKLWGCSMPTPATG